MVQILLLLDSQDSLPIQLFQTHYEIYQQVAELPYSLHESLDPKILYHSLQNPLLLVESDLDL